MSLDTFLCSYLLSPSFSDNIARGLINALLNSGEEFQIRKGRELMKKLKKQCKARKRM
jgi:hypothetical protein